MSLFSPSAVAHVKKQEIIEELVQNVLSPYIVNNGQQGWDLIPFGTDTIL